MGFVADALHEFEGSRAAVSYTHLTMKTVLVVLLILAAGAGAWFSGLSGLFGINGQYQDFQEMISYRKTLDLSLIHI